MTLGAKPLAHDLAILLFIGILGALSWILNYTLIRRTRWGQ
jgi:hypothetical protein